MHRRPGQGFYPINKAAFSGGVMTRLILPREDFFSLPLVGRVG